MNFKFGQNIRRHTPSKTPLKILETRGRGRSQGLSKIFRAAIYTAHRAVVFAIAQLSCVSFLSTLNLNITATFLTLRHVISYSWLYDYRSGICILRAKTLRHSIELY